MSEPLVDRYDLLIFDLDGVVYLGSEPVPHAVEVLNRLHASGTTMRFATNNASRRPDEVAALLGSLGLSVTADEVVSSPQAAAALLADRLPAGATVLVVGTDALAEQVAAVGLKPARTAEPGVAAVVQGYGPQVGWPELAEACVAVRDGALWVATNADRTLPSPRGPLPGNGSLIAVLATALSRGPDEVVGKPAPALFQRAAASAGASRPLVVGDRLDTDIAGAHRAGMDSLLVLTGVSTPADVLAAPQGERPTYLAEDLTGLYTVDSDGSWQVRSGPDGLVLSGTGRPLDALRALCGAAWSGVPSTKIIADGPDAAAAARHLGLA